MGLVYFMAHIMNLPTEKSGLPVSKLINCFFVCFCFNIGMLVPHGIWSQLKFILSERLNAESTAL